MTNTRQPTDRQLEPTLPPLSSTGAWGRRAKYFIPRNIFHNCKTHGFVVYFNIISNKTRLVNLLRDYTYQHNSFYLINRDLFSYFHKTTYLTLQYFVRTHELPAKDWMSVWCCWFHISICFFAYMRAGGEQKNMLNAGQKCIFGSLQALVV